MRLNTYQKLSKEKGGIYTKEEGWFHKAGEDGLADVEAYAKGRVFVNLI
jgi:hypothetical protein